MDDATATVRQVIELEAPGGERARLVDGELWLLNSNGETVVRYTESSGVRIVAEQGNLTLAAPNGSVVIESEGIEMRTKRWRTHSEQVQHVAGRFELRAERAVETVVDVYRTCRGLMQVRAQRARQLIDGAYEVIAGRATITSDEETRIDGKKLLLG